jgi:hypothetical protein
MLAANSGAADLPAYDFALSKLKVTLPVESLIQM